MSGEMPSAVYLASKPSCLRDAKDNALMTPMMNSVSSGQFAIFTHLHFQHGCELKNIDINGNTLLHLAAKANSLHIARVLRHIYLDQTKEDSSIETNQLENSGASES